MKKGLEIDGCVYSGQSNTFIIKNDFLTQYLEGNINATSSAKKTDALKMFGIPFLK